MTQLKHLLLIILLLTATTLHATDYELVTSADQLVAGCNYIIGNAKDGSGVFMSTAVKADNREKSKSATISSNEVTLASDMLVMTLGGSTGAWTFLTTNYLGTNGYLNATSTESSNILRITNDDTYKFFTIEINSDNSASIKCRDKDLRHIIRYNSDKNAKLFSCYTGGQDDVYLFKEIRTTSLSVSSAGYATYYNSQDAYIMPTGMTGYTFADGKIQKTYDEGSIVPKDVALVLKANEGNYTLRFTVGGTAPTANKLRGSDADATTTGGEVYYKLSDGSNGIGFYWAEDDGAAFTNGAHKAYLALTSSEAGISSPANAFVFGDDDDTTAICAPCNDKETTQGKAYTIIGQPVNAANAKGILIINGRKILNR